MKHRASRRWPNLRGDAALAFGIAFLAASVVTYVLVTTEAHRWWHAR